MTYIPDCRTDENYNFDKLTPENKEYVKGFDHCVDEAVKSFFYNLDVYYDDDSYFMHFFSERLPDEVLSGFAPKEMLREDQEPVVTYGDLFKNHLLHWIESERDELITGLIDGQWEKAEDSQE